jgi:histidinol-phosphate aminotransferase
VATLDLSQTTWPELPHANISAAITFTARRGLQRYPHQRGSELRAALAERHEVPVERLIIGNGAAELLSSATRALIEPGQELLTAWPSYPLYPIMARRANGRAVPVAGGVDALLGAAAQSPDARVVALANPNDPTGELLAVSEIERLLRGLPEGVAVLLDEALVEFADAQPTDASLALLEEHSQLIVFRSFSKAWGLAGIRIGYAIGGPGAEKLLAELEPDLGVSEVSQSGALEALRSGEASMEHHVRCVREERERLTAELRARGFAVAESQANFLWVAHRELDGSELATRLNQAGVLVAAGAALGQLEHVRIALRNVDASARLLGAIDKALARAA